MNFISTFAEDIIRLVYKLGDFCSSFFTAICTQTVDEYVAYLLGKFNIPFISDVLEILAETVLSSVVGNMLMIEFLLYGGILISVVISLKKLIF